MGAKICLTIAGSDCSGGAGIQADLKTFAAHGCYGASVITSVVAENTSKVISVYNVPADEVRNQINAVFEDMRVDAVKLGMLPDIDIIEVVAERLKYYKPPFVVCDPVLKATSGGALSANGATKAYEEHIFPVADLITPNIPEAEAFTGMDTESVSDMCEAAKKLCSMGSKAVLLKGGHLKSSEAEDVLFDGKETVLIKQKMINSQNTHGTGCTLSSAIAAGMAKGFTLKEAVISAKDYITKAIENSYTVGKGHSPVNHFYAYWDKL